jgi:hypothetical protein
MPRADSEKTAHDPDEAAQHSAGQRVQLDDVADKVASVGIAFPLGRSSWQAVRFFRPSRARKSASGRPLMTVFVVKI